MEKDISVNDVKIHKEEPSNEGNIMVSEDVYIIVTKAFCPNGHNLIGNGGHTFDGYPGIKLKVSSDSTEGYLEVSPFHGDHRRHGVSFENGEKVKIMCPECESEFPVLGKCNCQKGHLHTIYLTEKLSETHMIAVCDQWGCYLSRVIDDNDLFSEFIDDEWENS
ncbi:MAG: hypothetical protein JXR95_14040 [Deltaproteobacteria bacterium]|nr:hypothetical protein [Deltaproteobacteria bacterium]